MNEYIPISRKKYFDKHDISSFPKTLKESESDGVNRFKSKLLHHVATILQPPFQIVFQIFKYYAVFVYLFQL